MKYPLPRVLVFISLMALVLTSACISKRTLDPTASPETQLPLPTASQTDAYPPPVMETTHSLGTPVPYPISTHTVRPTSTRTTTIESTSQGIFTPDGWPTGQTWTPPPPFNPFAPQLL